MVTVVNNPQPSSSEGDGGTGFLIGIILIIVVVFLFLYYGLPMIRTATSVPDINVPEKIDVNVNQTQ